MKPLFLALAAASLAAIGGATMIATCDGCPLAGSSAAVAEAPAPAPTAATAPAQAASVVFLDEKGNRVTPTAEQLATLKASTKSVSVQPGEAFVEKLADPNDPSMGYVVKVPRRTLSVARINDDGSVSAHCLPTDAAEAFLAEANGVESPAEASH